MISYKRATGGLGLVGLAVLLTACSSGGSASSTTTTAGGGTPTTAGTASQVTSLAPQCPASGSAMQRNAIAEGGTHWYYSFAGADYTTIVRHCTTALTSAGWTVTGTGSGGSGQYGGGGGTAVKGSTYAVFGVGSSGTTSYLDVCVWPTKPASTDCGQNGNQNQDQQNQDQQNQNTGDNQN